MWGYPMEEIVGHSTLDFLDEENLKIVKEQLAKRKKGEGGSYELTWTRKDGQKIHTILTPTPPLDADGRYKGSYGFITDITERKRAEEALHESKERYQTLMDNIDLGINLIDLDHNILMVNTAQNRHFKKPMQATIGKKCFREFEKRRAVCPHCPA